MNMRMIAHRAAAWAAAALLLATGLCVPLPAGAEDTGGGTGITASAAAQDTGTSYYFYQRKYGDKKTSDQSIEIDVTTAAVVSGSPKAAELYTDREGSAAGVCLATESGVVSWPVTVEKGGMYYLRARYLALPEVDYAIEFGVMVDDSYPYDEARTCSLSRVFDSKTATDAGGYHTAEQRSEWQTRYLREQSGFVGDVCVYLEKGTHTLSFEVDEGIPFLLEALTLSAKEYVLDYRDYLAYHKQRGAADTTGVLQLIQGEDHVSQSDASLTPKADTGSVLLQPFSYDEDLVNIGGGAQWTTPGEWLTWNFSVEQEGFYQLAFKYRQNYLDGLFSSRAVYIDGELPYQEMADIPFRYCTGWEMASVGDAAQDYLVYLTAGEHTLTLENVLGDLSETISVFENVSALLNDQYLAVLMITGSEPDPYKDYYLDKALPDLVPNLRQACDILQGEVNRLIRVVGKRGAETAYIEDVIFDLGEMADNIGSLTYNSRLSALKDIISGMSQKMIDLQNQALDIDYIAVYSPGESLPRTKMTFWQSLCFQVRKFIRSFSRSYEGRTADETETADDAVDIWLISGGETQYELICQLIRQKYTPPTGVGVRTRLVTGSLTQAIVSGIGPDVVIGTNADLVVNLALRGALEPLDSREGIDELREEYIPGSFTPMTLENELYGIPLTNDFPMLFVRTDIFRQLGLSVPKTWDEIIDISQILERQNMSLGCPPSFATLIFQNGGQYFDEKQTKVLFEEDVAVEALETVGRYFTLYGFPLSYDLVSRFRTGEMPIALAGYSTYVTLKYSAPEINGLWAMYTTPGTVQADGSLNCAFADSGGEGISMLSSAGETVKDAAWDFIRWFASADVQAEYGTELEKRLGIAGRYATANRVALDRLNWSSAEKKLLHAQMENIVYIPIVPGNYYITRGLNNAQRDVIYNGISARETLREWTGKINSEITRKRNEFSLNN